MRYYIVHRGMACRSLFYQLFLVSIIAGSLMATPEVPPPPKCPEIAHRHERTGTLRSLLARTAVVQVMLEETLPRASGPGSLDDIPEVPPTLSASEVRELLSAKSDFFGEVRELGGRYEYRWTARAGLGKEWGA